MILVILDLLHLLWQARFLLSSLSGLGSFGHSEGHARVHALPLARLVVTVFQVSSHFTVQPADVGATELDFFDMLSQSMPSPATNVASTEKPQSDGLFGLNMSPSSSASDSNDRINHEPELTQLDACSHLSDAEPVVCKDSCFGK